MPQRVTPFLGALLLAACASASPDADSSSDSIPQPTPVEESTTSADVTIELAAWKGNEAEPAGLPELIAEFEAEYPSIAVELTYASRIDIEIDIARRLSAGEAPDVLMVDMTIASPLIAAGQLADLGSESEWVERIDPDLQRSLTADGQHYVMPVEVIGMGNFVNLGLLEEAGVDAPPGTIDELADACAKLADAGIDPMVFTGGFSAALFMVANGVDRTVSSVADLGSGEASFVDDAAFNTALDTVRHLIDARCFDPTEQAGLDPWSTALTLFEQGKVAMMPQGAWNIGAFSSRDDLDFVFAPIPSNSPTGTTIDLFGFGLALPLDAQHPDEARRFIDWMARPENIQRVLAAESAYTPFDDGSSGAPLLARSFDEARAGGARVDYPVALLQWPANLEDEMWSSLTAFLLDPSMSNIDVFERWDQAVIDARGGS